jgi:hypothetical protein
MEPLAKRRDCQAADPVGPWAAFLYSSRNATAGSIRVALSAGT